MRRIVTVVATLASAAAVGAVSCGRDDAPTTDAGADDGSNDVDGSRIADAGSDATTQVDADAAIDASAPLVDTCNDAGSLPNAWLADPRLCLAVYADQIDSPRQMAFAPNGDLFVESMGHLIAAFDADKNGVVDQSERSVFADAPAGSSELNHGVAFSPDGAFVYASGAMTVYRWPYKKGDHVASGSVEVVVRDIPNGGHVTRTLAFDSAGRLYVSVGSAEDVDLDPSAWATRAMVRRFTLSALLPAGGIAYSDGEVFASGMRNEVGLAIDSKGRVWGVENGSDGTFMPPVNEENPAEELNRLDAPGPRFLGFPHCWSEHSLEGGLGPGTQWAYLTDASPGDSWCRDPSNVQRPAWVMPAHWAPLGVTEYTGNSLPWKGDLFITAHGSRWRVASNGRLVARAHLAGDTVVSLTPIVGQLGPDGGLLEGVTGFFRPVDIRTGPDGALYFSDDGGFRIYRLGYRP
jgi:glucose/arabinose dehydrogenase